MVLFLLSLLNSSVDAFVPHGVKGVRKHSKSSPLYAVAKAKKTKKSKVKKAKKVAKAKSKAVSTDVVVRRKKDVIAMVVERTGLTKAVCEQSFEAIMATIAEVRVSVFLVVVLCISRNVYIVSPPTYPNPQP